MPTLRIKPHMMLNHQVNRLVLKLRNDPTVEELPPTNDWERFRYRREETEGPLNGTEKFTGNYLYGIIYRTSKGGFTLVGEAVTDWREHCTPYGPMCSDPQLCLGMGHCPRDPTCGD